MYEGMMDQLSCLEVWILDCGRCCDTLLMQESCRFIAWEVGRKGGGGGGGYDLSCTMPALNADGEPLPSSVLCGIMVWRSLHREA